MSANNTEAEIIAQDWANFCFKCFTVSFQALFWYDFVITISQEVKFVWGRKFTGVTVIFLLNRYVLLVYLIMSNYVKVPCGKGFAIVFRMVGMLNCVTFLVVAAFSSLRVYAIRGRSKCWALAVLALALVPFVTNIYNVSHNFEQRDGLECAMQGNIPSNVGKKFVIATRVCALAADLLVLFATLQASLDIKFSAHMDPKTSLLMMVLRDGSIYFSTLFVLNVLQIAMTLSGVFAYTADYIEVLSSILISRFIFDLRQVHFDTGSMDTSLFALSDLHFVSGVVGNMGAPLRVGGAGSSSELDTTDEDEEELPSVAREPFKVDLGAAAGEEIIEMPVIVSEPAPKCDWLDA